VIIRAVEKLLDRISRLRVLVIGDIMLDHYIVGDVVRISPEAPVPVVAVENDRYALGAAANVALNVSQLGCATEIIGKIGIDSGGVLVENMLEGGKVFLDRSCKFSDVSTITKARVVVRGQQLCRIDREGKKSDYAIGSDASLGEICEKIRIADALILSDYAKGTLTNGNIGKFIGAALEGNTFVAIDPKPANGLKFSGVSLMTPNKQEAAQLVGLDLLHGDEFPMDEICEKICERFSPKNFAVTLGADGMVIREESGKILQIPTYAREVFDVSGAGDTVIACLTAALAVGESGSRAAKFANIAAGIVVSKHGTAAISAAELLRCEHNHLLNSDL
jgi:D-beta-D-heptose 7-phosphate kinase/D-beta-D-heptose 1-phosphate adenosyltransferase